MGCIGNAAPGCVDKFGCPQNSNGTIVCPDFSIRRHDTKPFFRFDVTNCDGPIDLTHLVCEASMWAKGKIKYAISKTDTFFSLADNIGFEQVLVDDIIVMDRTRAPEQMLVTGFDEANKLISIQRGYNGSLISDYPKGSRLKIFRVLNSVASTEMVKEDVLHVDGTTTKDILIKSSLVYEWQANDTCLPGCYWFEFKLLEMSGTLPLMYPTTGMSNISFISYTPSQTGCSIGTGVKSVQRYPTTNEGFLIRIFDSPTSENVMR